MQANPPTGSEGRPEASPAVPDRRLHHRLDRMLMAKLALPFVMLLFIVFFSIARTDTFFTVRQAQTLIETQSVLAIVTIALVLPLVIGEFDLSVGANLGLGAILATGLAAKQGLPLTVAVLLALVCTTAVGLINGLLVAKGGINSLVVTLATSTMVAGAVLWYTGGAVIFDGVPDNLTNIAARKVVGIPIAGVYLIVIATAAWYVLTQTPRGRQLYALGDSQEASRLTGLNVPRLTIFSFTVCGLIAGFAGVLQASQIGSGNPSVGASYLLPAFAAVFLGATSIRVGKFNVWGAVIAVFTLAVGITGLQLMGVPYYIGPIFNGAALLIAVASVRVLRQEAI